MESKKVSLYEFLNNARRRRKYYLQHRLKTYLKINSRKKLIDSQVLRAMPESEKVYLQELIREYGYSCQYSIPN